MGTRKGSRIPHRSWAGILVVLLIAAASGGLYLLSLRKEHIHVVFHQPIDLTNSDWALSIQMAYARKRNLLETQILQEENMLQLSTEGSSTPSHAGYGPIFRFHKANLRRLRKELQEIKAKEAAVEIAKQDCQKLVDGLLLFEPSTTMKQGQSYPIFARLSRSRTVKMAEGLSPSTEKSVVVIVEKTSCKVSMTLDSTEPQAFNIENIPAKRPDSQILEPTKYSQWDWRVTPRKNGTLHLLLYITPMLFVEGIGEELKQFPQAPRIITVNPDYIYETREWITTNWAILGGLVGAVFVPLFLWFRGGIVAWVKKLFKKKDEGFYKLPDPKDADPPARAATKKAAE